MKRRVARKVYKNLDSNHRISYRNSTAFKAVHVAFTRPLLIRLERRWRKHHEEKLLDIAGKLPFDDWCLDSGDHK